MFNNSRTKHPDFKRLLKSADGLVGKLPVVKKRRKLTMAYKFLKYGCLAAIILLAVWFIILSAELLSLRQIYHQALAGKEDLDQAIIFGRKGDFQQASALAASAENNFTFSAGQFNRLKNHYLLSHTPILSGQLDNVESLLSALQFLSKAVRGGANFGQNLSFWLSAEKKVKFSQLPVAEKRRILQQIFESAPELNGVKADLALALINLDRVSTSGFLFPLADKIEQARKQIFQAEQALAQAIPLSQLIPVLAGYPKETNFLVILQNNDELRPTGGFIGTYATLKIKDGEIISFLTDDIYHLDMPLENKISINPPEPIKKYLNNNWYMRDANWSPDWPTAAQKIDWFYQIESRLNKQFDGVLAITPKFITDFLEITGPIIVEGISYDQNNFQDLLQYRVEKGYVVLGESSWQRKAVIGEIAKIMKIKIFDLPQNKWPKIINTFSDNLAAKDLLFYFKDSQLEDLAVDSGWGGEIKKTIGDYLMVVDANLAALKTDAVISRGLNYRLAEISGGLLANLTLSYSHGGKIDWKTGVYKSYTRVYAPLGSQLIKISGYEPGQIDIGAEAGKTWFGFYFTVQPGEIRNFYIEYKLPPMVASGNNYSLYLQKQPGKEINETTVDLNFPNEIKSYSPASLSVNRVSPFRLKWAGELERDKYFKINF